MFDTDDVLYTVQTKHAFAPYGDDVGSPTNPRGAAFAALIREARHRRGWTQDTLVEKSGVSRSTVLRWEAGDASRPDPDQVRAVCRALGVDPRRAAVALGYLDPEDLNPPGEPRPPLSPELEEVVEALQNPRVPDMAKEALVGYLRELASRAESDEGPGSRRRAG